MPKVIKFGGSSLADGEKFLSAAAKARAENADFVVVSAPGKRHPGEKKLTDLLSEAADNGPFSAKARCEAALRLDGIARRLPVDRSVVFRIEREIIYGNGRDFLLSRGEFFSAAVMSSLLGFEFADGGKAVRFGKNGEFDIKKSVLHAKKSLSGKKNAVIPGFYGRDASGKIKTLPRGGSDITGAVVALATGAEAYLNCTDVAGVMRASPALVADAAAADRLCGCAMYGLSSAGAEVVHPEAVRALLGSGVPLIIKSTFGKQCGTLVSCAGCKSAAQCHANGPREIALTMPITTGNGDCEKISPVEAVSGKDGKAAVASPEMNRRTAAAIIGWLARLRIKVVRPKIVGRGCLMFETERDFTERAVVTLYRRFAEKSGGAG